MLSLRDRDPVAWEVLRAAGVVRRVDRGTVLMAEGDGTDHAVLIDDGVVKVVSIAENGCTALLAVRRSGDVVGEFAALGEGPRSATVHTLRASTVVTIGAVALRAVLQSHPDVGFALLRYAIARVRESDRRHVYACYDIAERVRRVLLELADLFGPDLPVTVPLSQQDLADLAGISREAVAKVLRRLRMAGVVSTSRSRIVVLRPDLLRSPD